MTTRFGGLCERAERLLSFGFVTVAETLLGGREGEREKGKEGSVQILAFSPFIDPMGKSHQFFNFPLGTPETLQVYVYIGRVPLKCESL